MAVLAIVVFDPDSLMNVMREERLAKLVGEDGDEYIVEDDTADNQTETNYDNGQQSNDGQTDGNEQTAETPNTTPNPDGNNGQGTDKK